MKIFKILIPVLSLALYACGGGGGSSDTPQDSGDATVNAPVTVNVQADYGDGRIAGRSYVTFYSPICPSPAPSTDSEGFAEGLDCDNDARLIKYVDPSSFSVAIKRLAFRKSDNSLVDLIADTGTLAQSQVLDLSNPVELNVSTLPSGEYTGVYAEFYYYDLTMPVDTNDNAQVRIFLSDDDFPAEGNLGHHQGDVQLLATADSPFGVQAGEFGFVLPGYRWINNNLASVRASDIDNDGNLDHIEGASTPDPETGHRRGLYGNDDLWNMEQFNQGDSQDIFILDQQSPASINVGSEGGVATITFDLTKTWFFEDSNGNGRFEPCIDNDEACTNNSEWTPVFPGIGVSFQ
jgi:hypothetical protein